MGCASLHFICLAGTAAVGPNPCHSPLAPRSPWVFQTIFPQPPVPVLQGNLQCLLTKVSAAQQLSKAPPGDFFPDRDKFVLPSEVGCAFLYSSTLLCCPPSFHYFIKASHWSLPQHMLCTHTSGFCSPPLGAVMSHKVLPQLHCRPSSRSLLESTSAYRAYCSCR